MALLHCLRSCHLWLALSLALSACAVESEPEPAPPPANDGDSPVGESSQGDNDSPDSNDGNDGNDGFDGFDGDGAVAAAPVCGGEPSELVALPARVAVGGFDVTIAADGAVDVTHRDTGARSLARSAPGELLRALEVDLHVEETQGSFAVEVDTLIACTSPRLLEAGIGGGTLTLRGGYNDGGECAGVRWEVTLCESLPGQLAFEGKASDPRFNALEFALASSADERIYGMGEQMPYAPNKRRQQGTLNLKGRTIPVLSQEGGVTRGRFARSDAFYSVVIDFLARFAGFENASLSIGNAETTYYAAPHYITSKLRSVFLTGTQYAEFDFGAADRIRVRSYAPTFSGRIVAGNTPKELVERFTAWSGRMPALPDWVHEGAIVALAKDLTASRQLLARLESRGAEIAAVWNQTWSGKAVTSIGEQVLWNWIQSPTDLPGWSDYVAELEARGMRTLCYLNPMLVALGADDPNGAVGVDPTTLRRYLFGEAERNGYLVRDESGLDDLKMQVTAFTVGLLDFSNPEARAWMKDIIKDEVIAAGCSGWMVDFAEALPFEATLASGESAAVYHNKYPVEWMRINREAIEEVGALGDILTFNRAGSARTPGVSLLVWEGDQMTTWDRQDGIKSAMFGLLGGGFSGIALNHSDTGGYTSIAAAGCAPLVREAELLRRWTEMNAFTAVLRTHEGNRPDCGEQVYGSDATVSHFARFTKVYKALGFYRRALMADVSQRGWPVARHLWMEFPNDERTHDVPDQFMLGSEFLVAPVLDKCAPWYVFGRSDDQRRACRDQKEVYLPPGEWVHLWSGRRYSGSRNVVVRAPVGEPPVFYRRGSAVAGQFRANLRAAGISVP